MFPGLKYTYPDNNNAQSLYETAYPSPITVFSSCLTLNSRWSFYLLINIIVHILSDIYLHLILVVD